MHVLLLRVVLAVLNSPSSNCVAQRDSFFSLLFLAMRKAEAVKHGTFGIFINRLQSDSFETTLGGLEGLEGYWRCEAPANNRGNLQNVRGAKCNTCAFFFPGYLKLGLSSFEHLCLDRHSSGKPMEPEGKSSPSHFLQASKGGIQYTEYCFRLYCISFLKNNVCFRIMVKTPLSVDRVQVNDFH